MAEILHTSHGLNVRRNDKNQFVIAELHYTADAAKRSEQWKREAEAGMSRAKFLREYEMDEGAAFGEKVFPEFISNKQRIVVQEPYPVFPEGQYYYGGFDYGMRNPSSFHVYTEWDGVTYAIWELYKPCRNIKEFSAELLACPYYQKIRYIAADPHIADLRHFGKDGNGASIMDQFAEQGVKKFFLSSNDEESWIAILRKHWANPEDPTFRMFDCCPAMVKEFGDAVYASEREALKLKNYKENIMDVNNHAMDDCKYYMLSNPRRRSGLQQTGWKYPIMVNKWLK